MPAPVTEVPRLGLMRRRSIWVPSWRGWLVATAGIALAIVAAARSVHPFLSPTRPVGGAVLIVEGWLPSGSLREAAEVFAAGSYEWLVTTGGPVVESPAVKEGANYARLAADFLVAEGVPADRLYAAEAPASAQNRTFLSAVMVRNWSQRLGQPVRGYDLFSHGTHARRSHHLYRLAFGEELPLGIVAASPSSYPVDAWWRSSLGTKAVGTEFVGWLWVKCCFWPAPPGSHEERWGESTASGRS
jgi:hypothetical protein